MSVKINENYVKGLDIDVNNLFIFKSVKEYAIQQLQSIDKKVNYFKEIVNLNNSPKVNIGTQCFKPYTCEFLVPLCFSGTFIQFFLFG